MRYTKNFLPQIDFKIYNTKFYCVYKFFKKELTDIEKHYFKYIGGTFVLNRNRLMYLEKRINNIKTSHSYLLENKIIFFTEDDINSPNTLKHSNMILLKFYKYDKKE